ncbi:MAG TPA: LON peptidase substrate-binding domain-containing protein [Verrucomicrobiota bacterium]|nr:LON peptidase substrate-binding domain-containing protein [Verrucomicrobiota bacterium]
MELPTEVPVMTLPNVILFPQAMLPLYIFEPRYRRMLSDTLETHRMIAVAMQKPGRVRECPANVAGLGLVRASVKKRDGTSNLVLQGIARVELTRRIPNRPYRIHGIRYLPRLATSAQAVQALAVRLLDLVTERLKLGFEPPFKTLAELSADAGLGAGPATPDETATEAFREVLRHLSQVDDPEQLVDLISATLLPSPRERQVILETAHLEDRLRHLVNFLDHDIERRKASENHD